MEEQRSVRGKMKRIWNGLVGLINNFKIRKKLIILFVFCVLLPMFATDGVILYTVYHNEERQKQAEMESIASGVQAELNYIFEEAVNVSRSFYINRKINEFLEYPFATPLDFYERSREYYNTPFYNLSFEGDGLSVVLFGDNEGILNGGQFGRTESLRTTAPYQQLEESGKDMKLCFYYQDQRTSMFGYRKICLIRRLNYYRYLSEEKLIRVDLDYSELVQRFGKMNYEVPIYICQGDTILFSNAGHSEQRINYDQLTGNEQIALEQTFTMCGDEFRVLILESSEGFWSDMYQHLPLLACLVLINILLPLALMSLLNVSFTQRLRTLSAAFDHMEGEELIELTRIEGQDEIADLMRNYNRMVRRLRELIQTVYKDRLEQQNTEIARQKAELLALRSQINPHFLFNVLESIRMHSILKGENETAEMVERLALLERQNVDWSKDTTLLSKELELIRNYLQLQKYRFGDRLSYEITAEESCRDYRIPSLTLMTFVENACVHGVEKKSTACWIYVRVYEKADDLVIEIEDTGIGLDEPELEKLTCEMEQASIEMLQQKDHVGMVNASLRLKMYTDNRVRYELESEKGVGTFLVLRIPLEKLGKKV